MSNGTSRYRFPAACPKCHRRFVANWSNIGAYGTCKCGHRFRIEGPTIATINASDSKTCQCPECGTAVICSASNPMGQHICCHCGKAFRLRTTDSAAAAPRVLPTTASEPFALPPPAALPDASAGIHPTLPQGNSPTPSGIREADDTLDIPDLPLNFSVADPESDYGESDPEAVLPDWSVEAASRRVDSESARQGATLVYECSGCGSFTTTDRRTLVGVPDSVQCGACGKKAAFHSSGEVGVVFGDALLTSCSCYRCGANFAVSGLREGGIINCLRCPHTFPKPQRYIARTTPSRPSATATTAYTYRPIPVRSFRRKNGTWVSGYRRSRPKKQR